MTAGIVFAISLYAMTTKNDFTICGGICWVLGISFLLLGVFCLVFGAKWRLVYCTLGVILFSLYLLFDTQMIMGGHRYEMRTDDYILGSIALYLDIINIFLYILRLLSGK